ncbi:hypothetical protein E9993_06200 [Labilibacter sediminis]|nr:hypothetical protein E9993_06200 [Labilibacter sediminis]
MAAAVVLIMLCALGEIFGGDIPNNSNNESRQSINFEVYPDSVKWKISDYLVGMHSVYCNDGDSLYERSNFTNWMRIADVGTMRYPGGGVVKYWDWENPTGVMQGDPFNPDWDNSKNTVSKDWTSLDEYLEMVKISGITPLLGVNITSGYRYGKVDESIARAVRMVEYVKSKGFGGAFWYLGNEGKNGGWENEAHLFVQHVKAMKKVDPDIKCMFNHNNMTKKYLRQYLKIAGDYADIVETHGKWPYGGNPKEYEPGTFNEWQIERPLRDRKNHNRAWRTEADSLRKWARELGYPGLKFANNEYGTGKKSNLIGFDRYTTSLLMIDMLQEHFIGNWYMTCYWYWVSNRKDDKDALIAFNHSMRYNPMRYGFELLAKAQGGNMLQMLDENNPSTYGFAVEKDGEYLLYLINKSNHEKVANVFIDKGSNLEIVESKSLVNTLDEFGELVSTNVDSIQENHIPITLPPLSYSRFIFKESSDITPSASVKGLSELNIKLYPTSTTGADVYQWLQSQICRNLQAHETKTMRNIGLSESA